MKRKLFTLRYSANNVKLMFRNFLNFVLIPLPKIFVGTHGGGEIKVRFV